VKDQRISMYFYWISSCFAHIIKNDTFLEENAKGMKNVAKRKRERSTKGIRQKKTSEEESKPIK
jgi:hypothetical protein